MLPKGPESHNLSGPSSDSFWQSRQDASWIKSLEEQFSSIKSRIVWGGEILGDRNSIAVFSLKLELTFILQSLASSSAILAESKKLTKNQRWYFPLMMHPLEWFSISFLESCKKSEKKWTFAFDLLDR